MAAREPNEGVEKCTITGAVILKGEDKEDRQLSGVKYKPRTRLSTRRISQARGVGADEKYRRKLGLLKRESSWGVESCACLGGESHLR